MVGRYQNTSYPTTPRSSNIGMKLGKTGDCGTLFMNSWIVILGGNYENIFPITMD